MSTSLLQPEFLKPRYWFAWLGIGLARLTCLLPLRARWFVGVFLGRLAWLIAGRRRHIVRTNLRLCFPSLDEQAMEKLVCRNFDSSGMSIIETASVWFLEPDRFNDLVDIEGLDILKQAVGKGQGVLLVGMHLSTLDFCGAVLGRHQPFDVMYRRNKNKLLEAVMTRGRERNFDGAIERTNIRQVIRRLKQGAVVWYGPDQDYGRKHSVFAPFFGVPAATITATARIVSMTGAEVVVFSHYRRTSAGRYLIRLERLPAPYPSGNEIKDCTLLNHVIEQAILEDPEQYWWVHRRFKTRPEGQERPY